MQEVRLYEENPPAFYGVFAPAELENIETKRKPMKVAVFGIGGLFGGVLCSLGLVLLGGILDPRMRTPGEAAKTLGVPLLGALKAGGCVEEFSDIGGRLWTRWIGNGGRKKARAVWAPAPDASENDFWRMMLTEARKLLPGLLVVDCGEDSPPAVAELPRITDSTADDFVMIHRPISHCSLGEAQKFAEMIDRWRERGFEVWVRFAGPVQEPVTTLARALDAPLVLVPLHVTKTGFWKAQADLFRHSACPPCGVLALNDTPPKADEPTR